ncbi:MAG: Dabb family protein, partial [Planctomycetota bacterium]|nr:Dabb family protein [Planctomycetota bacterium]
SMHISNPPQTAHDLARRFLQRSAWLVILGACVSCAKEQAPDTALVEKPATNQATTSTATGTDVEELKLGPNEVLRHAVFFKFKAESTAEDVQQVVDAFRALPGKIPEIIDFQWGVNNSPEKLNDEFTHCFLLTFADDAGRKIYLPHKEHKAFGDVLRPHKDAVFVIDYVGTKQEQPIKKALQHAVFFKFKDDVSEEAIKQVEAGFAELPGKIEAIKAFEWGRNNSPEKHAAGFTHCFMVTFDSEAGRESYLPHADHLAFVDVLKPSLDKVRVLDFWAEK